MMTKTFKITLLLFNIVLIVLLITAGFYLKYSVQKSKDEMDQIYLRKEDMLDQQQRLGLMILELNSTLQMEIERNTDLTEELDQVILDQEIKDKSIEEQRALQEALKIKQAADAKAAAEAKAIADAKAAADLAAQQKTVVKKPVTSAS